jgi:hypothetical protein
MLVDVALNSANEQIHHEPSASALRILYLYSGPQRDADGFSTFCKANDLQCDYIDKEFNADHDLLDQQVWDELEATMLNLHTSKRWQCWWSTSSEIGDWGREVWPEGSETRGEEQGEGRYPACTQGT